MTCAAVIVAAGSGSRMGMSIPKQYAMLAGLPVLVRAIRPFLLHSAIDRIVVVAPPDRLDETASLLAAYDCVGPRVACIPGGQRRQDSVLAGLKAVPATDEIVLIHDGARPLLTKALIDRCIEAARQDGAAIAAIPEYDTLKRQDEHQRIAATVSREGLWRVQTPQAARLSLLLDAFAQYGQADVTDEAALLEMAGIPVALVEGERTNIKITRPEDLTLIETLLSAKSKTQMKIKTGLGQDSHKFEIADRKKNLILGGVIFEGWTPLEGNSDADVVLHAITNSISSITGVNIIGKVSDHMCKEMNITDSKEYLKEALKHFKDYTINHVSISIECMTPLISPKIEEMKLSLSRILKINSEDIGITATSGEYMTAFGRGEGIQVLSIVTATRK
ncbi:MAG: 2-C-methyl-D-erythritol 4-phosphate cytidylyltransferase [Desulfobulbaceae bacterium]|jgi:2-C-methyl-D-erythritol 4-phosphate cytidylyltransferase/2-C-methyl-D-erythritol 2,4-cyclodiphosphate synthase|nr:2-C-methyl-D-erythritol 4-phosphate cytidylyltransferase [Desulfobulbaceae bacterium]